MKTEYFKKNSFLYPVKHTILCTYNNMKSLLHILNATTLFFEKRGIENPRLDSELIIAHSLGCNRLDLYLQFERVLKNTELDSIRPLVIRRAKREPLQYILGETEFCGLKFKTDKRALIPRPETEELVELIIEKTHNTSPSSILELGTGSGVIASALAKRFEKAKITAVDFSKEALCLAAENIQSNALHERITLILSDWFDRVQGSFSLIVSNPPYLTDIELQTAEPEVRKYEPCCALVAPDQGISALQKILKQAIHYLEPNGIVALETGISQHSILCQSALETGYKHYCSFKDLNGRDRFFFTWR
jgi:release factor glutamine methyltransferase